MGGHGHGIGTYHLTEGVRQGEDPLSNNDPSWYFRGGRRAAVRLTVYCLHNLTGLWVRQAGDGALGVVLPQREFRGRPRRRMDDST